MILPLVLAGLGVMAWRRARARSAQDRTPASRPPGPPRPEQIGSTAARTNAALAEHEAAVERFGKRSLVLLAGTTAGALISPIFTAVAVPFLIAHAFPLFRQGYVELRARKVGGGVVRALAGGGMLLTGSFWVLSLSSVLFGYTDKLQIRVRRRSQHRLGSVFGELPHKVWIRRGAVDVEVAFEDLAVGDLVVVGAGQAIPVDGRIESGEASIDQQALTGEAQPAEKAVGASVLAATVVLSGSIAIRVERTGAATVVASIEEILNRTTEHTSAVELKGKVIADRTIVPTLTLAAVAQLLLGDTAGVCMLALYPGEGMRMLGPLSLLNYVRHAAEQRILIKDGRVLEVLQEIDTVVFDKTGTLTEKIPRVGAIHVFGSASPEVVLGLAAAAELRQQHPIALAIRQEAAARGLALPSVQEASYRIGLGVQVTVDGAAVLVGSRRFLGNHAVAIAGDVDALEVRMGETGHSLVYVAEGARVLGAIELVPRVRDEVVALVKELQARGMAVYILSGDHAQATESLARELGVDDFVAGTLPDQKAERIRAWQAQGKRVCFVGDGINDSIALRTADVSVSLTGASTIASDTANVVLLDGNLERLPLLFDLAKDLAVNMRHNLAALLAPSPVLAVGIAFLGFRIPTTLVLTTASGLAGLANATLVAERSLKQLQDRSRKLLPSPRPMPPPPDEVEAGAASVVALGEAAPATDHADADGPPVTGAARRPLLRGHRAARPGGRSYDND